MAAIVAAPPALAAGGAAAAGNPLAVAVVSRSALARAHIGMATAAAVLALFAFTLKPFTFPQLPDECATTAREIMALRFYAGLLLMLATAQAGTAAAALVVVPPSWAGRFLGVVANLLGLLTQYYFIRLLLRVFFATGGYFCLTGHVDRVLIIFYVILAAISLYAIPFLWVFGQGQ